MHSFIGSIFRSRKLVKIYSSTTWFLVLLTAAASGVFYYFAYSGKEFFNGCEIPDGNGGEHECRIVLKTWQKVVYTIVSVIVLLFYCCKHYPSPPFCSRIADWGFFFIRRRLGHRPLRRPARVRAHLRRRIQTRQTDKLFNIRTHILPTTGPGNPTRSPQPTTLIPLHRRGASVRQPRVNLAFCSRSKTGFLCTLDLHRSGDG